MRLVVKSDVLRVGTFHLLSPKSQQFHNIYHIDKI